MQLVRLVPQDLVLLVLPDLQELVVQLVRLDLPDLALLDLLDLRGLVVQLVRLDLLDLALLVLPGLLVLLVPLDLLDHNLYKSSHLENFLLFLLFLHFYLLITYS